MNNNISKITLIVLIILCVGGISYAFIDGNKIKEDNNKIMEELEKTVLNISRDSVSINSDGEFKIITEIKNAKDNGEVTYSVLDSDIVSVNSEGVVTALKPGKTKVTVTYKENDSIITKECDVVVSDEMINANKISVSNSISIKKNERKLINIKIEPSNSKVELQYKSDNENIAIVDKDGFVKGINAGKTIIRINDNISNISTSIIINVIDESKFELNVSKNIIEVGSSVQINANSTNDKISWFSSNNNIATVKDGLVSGISEGKVIITAKIEKDSSNIEIIVKNNVIEVESVRFIDSSLNLYVNDNYNLKYEVLPSNASDKTVWFESDNSNIVSVEKYSGVLKVLEKGKANITVHTNNGNKKNVITVSSSYKYKAPNSVDNFQIMYNQGLYAYDINETDVKRIKDAGFTLVPLTNRSVNNGVWLRKEEFFNEMEKAIKLFNKYNINVIVFDIKFKEIHQNLDVSLSDLKTQIEKYCQYENVVGFDLGDEPLYSSLEHRKKYVEMVNSVDNKREIYINLFPSYASSKFIGNSYFDYLSKYASIFKGKSKVLSIDYYPLPSDIKTPINKDSYYTALNNLRNVAKKNSLLPMNITASTTHSQVKNISQTTIAWQTSSNIAHGMKRISYFTYTTKYDSSFIPSGPEMVDNNKNITTRYNEVKTINSIVSNIGKQVYKKNILNVVNVNNKCNGVYLSSVDSSNCLFNDNYVINTVVDVLDNDALITLFDDKNTFMFTATSVENNKKSSFLIRWPSQNLSWFNYETNKYEKFKEGVLDKHKLYNVEKVGSGYRINITTGYPMLLKNN